MSLLEDVFLEDEAGEAQELERVIEGEEYDERPLSPNSDENEEKDDEAEEDKRRVDPSQAKTKRVVKNPRFILNPARLTGPRGIQVIPDHFKDFKFRGKGHEKEDLDMVLKKLEHWAYRLYPKFGFHDCLKKIETLGKKRPVMVHLTKIRSDQLLSDETVVQKDSSDDEATEPPAQEDEFDKLLQQQIELARSTPAPGSVKKAALSTPSVDRSLMMPKATSSPSIIDEQRERMLRNRRLAEERRLAKLRNSNPISETPKENIPKVVLDSEGSNKKSEDVVSQKQNRSVIDSSDDEPDPSRSVAVDVHNVVDDNIENGGEKKTQEQKDTSDSDDEMIARKHHRSNAIDSSDEDDLDVNHTVEVDLELNFNEASKQNNLDENGQNVYNEPTVDQSIDVDNVLTDQNNSSENISDTTKTNTEDLNPTENVVEKTKVSDKDINTDSKLDNSINTNSEHGSMNIEESTEMDDAMDVDFSEDF